jgi:hypothetical protein
MAFPTLTTSIAWGYGPKDASPVWTVIPFTLVVEAHFQSCGRQLDLDQFQGGGGSIVLNNADGRFTPGNTASPYYPNVRFGTPIKQEATISGNTYTVWRGVIEDTPVAFEPPSRSRCEWPIVDAFADLESQEADYPWRMRIRRTGPKAWLRFEEAAGSTQAIDSSGNANHGTYVGSPTLEVQFGTSRGATFNGTSQWVQLPLAAALSGTGDFAIEFFADLDVSAADQTIYEQFDPPTGAKLYVNVLGSGSGSVVQLLTTDAGGSTNLNGVADVTAGAEKHIIVRRQGTTHEILINGVVDATSTGTARSVPAKIPTVMGTGDGTIDEFITYQQTVSQALAQAHYQSVLAYHALTAGVQIGYLLDSFGWPTADRSIDTGTELVLGQFDPQGSVLDMLRAASDADFGAFYVTPQGIMRFRARNSILVPPYTTVQGAFGNTGSLLGVVVRSLKLEYQRRRIKNDITLRVNYATSGIATPFVVEVRKQDATSAGLYGVQTWSKDVLTVAAGGTAPIAARLGDLIDWTLAHYKDPIREVRELELLPTENSTVAYWLQVLQRVQEDRISHTHTAPGGEVISGDYHIQRVSHDIGPEKQWRTTWTISPTDTMAYWILDTAALDTGTRLGA